MKEIVDRILEILRPRRSLGACEQHVVSSVRSLIFRADPKLEMQFMAVAQAAVGLEKALDRFPAHYLNLCAESFRVDLADLRTKSVALAKAAKAPSGAAKRYLTREREAAAYHALDLVICWHDKPPSLTKGGPYLQVASMLFESATGRHEADLERVCRKQLGKVVGTIENYRRIKKAGRDAGIRAPSYRRDGPKKPR